MNKKSLFFLLLLSSVCALSNASLLSGMETLKGWLFGKKTTTQKKTSTEKLSHRDILKKMVYLKNEVLKCCLENMEIIKENPTSTYVSEGSPGNWTYTAKGIKEVNFKKYLNDKLFEEIWEQTIHVHLASEDVKSYGDSAYNKLEELLTEKTKVFSKNATNDVFKKLITNTLAIATLEKILIQLGCNFEAQGGFEKLVLTKSPTEENFKKEIMGYAWIKFLQSIDKLVDVKLEDGSVNLEDPKISNLDKKLEQLLTTGVNFMKKYSKVETHRMKESECKRKNKKKLDDFKKNFIA